MCKITEQIKNTIWEKAIIVNNYNPAEIRKDACGAWIRYDKYGDRSSIYGWEVDHIFPKSVLRERNVLEEEINQIDNLRPLNWQNNDAKGTDYPAYHTRITSDGDKNVEGNYEFVVSDDVQKIIDGLYGKYLK